MAKEVVRNRLSGTDERPRLRRQRDRRGGGLEGCRLVPAEKRCCTARVEHVSYNNMEALAYAWKGRSYDGAHIQCNVLTSVQGRCGLATAVLMLAVKVIWKQRNGYQRNR